jgi:hypothetical protein
LGQAIVANSAGAITAYHVAFGELNLLGPSNRVVQALTYLRDHPDYRFHQLVDLAGAPLSDTGWVEAVVGCSGNWVLADYRLRIPRGVRARLPRWPSRAWFQRTCGLATTVCSGPASTKAPTGAARPRPIPTRI